MIYKIKSTKKFTPLVSNQKPEHKQQQKYKKLKKNQNESMLIKSPVVNKSSKSLKPIQSLSNKSLNSKKRFSISKSIQKQKEQEKKMGKENKIQIQKEFTKQTFKRHQQRLNICSKIQQLIVQIKERQSKLKSFFQIYRILESQTGQQRCLQHNNDLSLYCLTQNRILCVHCIYGVSKHKTHKVLPLKDCCKDISKDVVNLHQTIQRDLQDIRLKIKVSQMNQTFIQRHYRHELIELQKRYQQKLHQLQVDFCQKKKYLNQHFNQIINKNSEFNTILKNFESNINVKLSILRKDENPYKPIVDEKQISKQTILVKISQLSDLKGMSIQNFDEKDLGQNYLRQRIKTSQK